VSAIQFTTIEDAIQAWIVTGSGLASDHVIWTQQTAPRPSGMFIAMRLIGIDGADWDWYDRVDNPLVFVPIAVTGVTPAADTITATAHGLVTGDGPIRFTTTNGLPAPLTPGANYWAIVVDANTIKVAVTFANAVAASPVAIDLTTTGAGTINIVSTATTVRAGQEVKQYTRGPRTCKLTLQCFAGAPTGGSPTGPSSPLAVLHDAVSAHALELVNNALVAAGVGVAGWDPIQSVDGVVNTTRFEPRAITTVHLHLASEIVQTSTYIETINDAGTYT
jgi:hypothetical protein